MKFIASVLFASLLAGVVFAEAAPPADPPKPGDPKPGDPADPAKPPGPPPIVNGTEWAKTWQEARDLAAKRSGYALMFITVDKKRTEKDAPHTSRLMNYFFNHPKYFTVLNEQFGCWKGTLAEARVAAAKQVQDAGVTTGPAVLFVDPDNGNIVDSYVGNCTYLELDPVLFAVAEGNHRKGLEKKLADKANQGDPHLNYLYGMALLRADDLKEAKKAFDIGATAKGNQMPQMKDRMESQIGLVWIEFKQRKYKEAIDAAQKLLEELPEFPEPRGSCWYIQMSSYYALNELDECQKIALTLREKAIRTTYGWKMLDDAVDIGYDFPTKRKFTPGDPIPPEETPK